MKSCETIKNENFQRYLKFLDKNFVVSDTPTNKAAEAIKDLTIVGPRPE